MAAVGFAPSSTVLAEDVRELQNWSTMTDGAITPAASRVLLCLPMARRVQALKRALDCMKAFASEIYPPCDREG